MESKQLSGGGGEHPRTTFSGWDPVDQLQFLAKPLREIAVKMPCFFLKLARLYA